MNFFKVYPVIDILNSKVVHAVKGERDKYTLLKSPLFNTNEPLEIILQLKETYNLNQFYIADLDAIMFEKPNMKIINNVLDIVNIETMIDPGIKSIDHLKIFSGIKLDKIILGLETIQNITIIKESFKFFSKDKIIVSIDMYKEKLFTSIEKLKKLTPLDITRKLEKIGIKKIILLDLYKVGQKLGGISPLYIKIKDSFSGDVLIGGGIKNLNDVRLYYKNSFSGVLIGTALYDGTINPNELKRFSKSINKNYT
ncbi:MAG: HisA/HisF-related TIM barrel protein [Promethearchaeota archaeon]